MRADAKREGTGTSVRGTWTTNFEIGAAETGTSTRGTWTSRIEIKGRGLGLPLRGIWTPNLSTCRICQMHVREGDWSCFLGNSELRPRISSSYFTKTLSLDVACFPKGWKALHRMRFRIHAHRQSLGFVTPPSPRAGRPEKK